MARGIIAVLALTSAVCLSGCNNDPAILRAPAQTQGASQRIEAIGRLEPADGVYQIGGMTGDRLGHLEVEAGQHVERGQVLAYLDSYAIRQAQLSMANAQLAEARSQLAGESTYAQAAVAEARLGLEQFELTKLDIEVQEAQIRAYEASLQLARANLERMQGLPEELTSAQQLEAQQLAVRQAEEQLVAARSNLQKLQAGQEFARRQAEAAVATAATAEQRVAASSRNTSLEAAVTLAESQVESSIVRSPINATVLQILTRPGEPLGRAPIMTLADTTRMVAVAEVYETDVRRVAVGQAARISSPALGGAEHAIAGRVIEIGRSVAQNKMFELDPTRMRADARVVEVRIALDDPAVAERYLNLQVDVTIYLDETGSADSSTSETSTSETPPAPVANDNLNSEM